ncbi:protein associated with UVRAG as autophagy enhancer isoform X2 [Nycticebus coucang]|uniref:protein associated with UVRAG as autophagy enhancer isoform X2 n=1 Tax=Nycticebus coucang TaxID=9470 RepID=UPI00234D8937|nr:protein associated with UVRAG as autophagy enhancer isoform X2 [Nycticebus coucang]
MVSQSTSWQDSSVDPWERISNDSSNIHSLPSLLEPHQPPCPLDIRFIRNKAAWINPQCLQQELQDLAPQVPAMGNIVSSSGPPPPSLGDSLTETSLSEHTVDSPGSACAHRGGKKLSDLSLTSTEEQLVLPGRFHSRSLPTSAKILALSPCPRADRAFFGPSHLTASADKDAVQVRGRTISLNSFSPEALEVPVDVEKENAHFYVADMIISTMEKIKCNILSEQQAEGWRQEGTSGSLGIVQADSEVTSDTNIKQESVSATSSDSGYEGCAVLQVSPVAKTPTYNETVKETCKCDFEEFVILEVGEFNDITETCGCSCSSPKSVTYDPDFNSAELLARELYRVFRKCWMLSVINYQLAGSLNAAGSVVVDEERVQEDFESSMSMVQDIKFKSRIRGTEEWAPPRFQIIFNIHPPLKRDVVVAAQNFFCAGCGTPIEPKFVKRLRYCQYLGKYFCDCCHSYAESCIPSRILMMWDFRKYHVSNFSKRLLDSIWHQPIFNLLRISQSLYEKAKELDRVKDIQEQLFHVKKLLKTCRFADSCVKERALSVNFARTRLSSSHFRLQRAEDVQSVGLAFTSSVSSPPGAPGVPGCQLGEDFWKVCPLQRLDASEHCEKDLSACLKITPICVYHLITF